MIYLNDFTLEKILRSQLSLQLTTLKLDECSYISDKIVQQIWKLCKILENVSLCFCRQLTDNSFITFTKQNISLKSISLGGCGNFTDITIEKIAKYCPKLIDCIIPW